MSHRITCQYSALCSYTPGRLVVLVAVDLNPDRQRPAEMFVVHRCLGGQPV